MPLFESAVRDNGLKAIAFDTLPVELEWVTVGLLHGLVGQKYWGWGYDTVHMLYEHTLFATPYESGLTPAWTS
jgi:ribose transport system substrate-binding protein